MQPCGRICSHGLAACTGAALGNWVNRICAVKSRGGRGSAEGLAGGEMPPQARASLELMSCGYISPGHRPSQELCGNLPPMPAAADRPSNKPAIGESTGRSSGLAGEAERGGSMQGFLCQGCSGSRAGGGGWFSVSRAAAGCLFAHSNGDRPRQMLLGAWVPAL